jgi:hypothetical protein
MEDALDPEGRSALDYARHHGLCAHYDREQICHGSLPTTSVDNFNQDLWDPSNMSIANTVTTLIRERLAVNKDAILLLKAVHELQQKPPDDGLKPDRYQRIQSLKQELPVLRTDNELDLLHFGSLAVPDFKDLEIPFESVDQEDGGGFEWPTKYIAYPIQWERKIKAEKLAVSKDVLLHLRDAITDTYTDDDYENIKEDSLRYKPVGTASTLVTLTKSIEPCLPTRHSAITTAITTTDALHTVLAI